MPFVYWLHCLDGTVEPELINVGDLSCEHHVAIDVGANIGLWSYRMAKIFSKVYAFEINEGIAENLVAYQSKKIEIIHCGLSSEPGDATLYIPVSKGVVMNGWASLQPGNCPDTQEHVTKPVKVRPLDSFSIRDVSFIKIDVEGHEIEVLRGAVETISASRPVVLVEVKETNVETVYSFFKALDYEEVVVEDATVLEGVAANHVFRPRKKRSQVV